MVLGFCFPDLWLKNNYIMKYFNCYNCKLNILKALRDVKSECFLISKSVAFIGLFALYIPTVKAQFRASIVKLDITPTNAQYLLGYGERKSTGVHDHIFHRIIALDDGKTQFYLISSDFCLFSPSEYDKITHILQQKFGIKPMNVWWSVTHTHSAPELGVTGLYGVYMGDRVQHSLDSTYTAFVEEKLIEGVLKARNTLVPARLGVGWGYSNANINRRAIDINGKASLGLNPDGPVDRRIGLLRIDKEDGSPLALIANYPIHGTVLGGENLLISGDVQGTVSDYVQEKIGVPVLFINGAAGNLAPIYSVYPTPQAGHLDQFRVLLGDKILDAYRHIVDQTDSVKIQVSSIMVETPRKQNFGWSSDLSKYTKTTNTGVKIVKLPVRFLKFNEDIAIWSAPVELFCEVSNYIREHSPFPYTFYYGYTNGWFGYLPTSKAWTHGGYEPKTSPFTPQAAEDLQNAVLGYLQGEMRKPYLFPNSSK
jgi:hypothetical protein